VNSSREHDKADLLRFLRTIQRAGVPVESLKEHERLVASGLIDSLAILEIISYLECTHGIDFSTSGVDPEQLGSLGGILDLIEGQKKNER
jgi:acyl carrier protein